MLTTGPGALRRSVLLLLSLVLVSGLASGVRATGGDSTGVGLKDLAAGHNLMFGALDGHAPFAGDANPAHESLFEQEFAVETSFVDIAVLHPAQGVYDFEAYLDGKVDRVEASGTQLFLTPLVYHDFVLPGWITQGNWTRETLSAVLEDWIKTVVGRYSGRVMGWVVVNEPTSYDSVALYDNVWRRVIGDDYIDLAFQWAREADPNALLYINDTNVESNDPNDANAGWMLPRSGFYYQLVQEMVSRSVPIDGVGLQMHTAFKGAPHALPRSPAGVAGQVQRFADLGLKVAITEMDVGIDGAPGTVQERLVQQAQHYRDIVEVCIQQPACDLMLVWGVSDTTAQYNDFSGVPGSVGQPVLFDVNYQPKPAYDAIVNLLQTAGPFDISGVVSYFSGQQAVPGVQVAISGDSTQTIDAAPNGSYVLVDFPDGAYTVTPSKVTDLGGVSATDALKAVRHAAGLEVLTDPNALVAGDVDTSGAVNATDGLKIVRYTAGLESFPAGDWRFAPGSRSYDSLTVDLTAQDFVGVRVGDVNGSWVPDGGVARPAVVGPDVRLVLADGAADGMGRVRVPVRVEGGRAIGAMTLFVSYPEDALRFERVDGFPGEVVAGAGAGVLRLVWADLTGISPVRFESGFVLNFSVREGGPGPVGRLEILNGTELADEVGNVVPVAYTGGAVRDGVVPGAYALSENYPNPFNPETQITYELPEPGVVSLVVYNVLGQSIRTLVRGSRDAGIYRVVWEGLDDYGRPVASGIYVYRMVVEGRFSQERRMVLMK